MVNKLQELDDEMKSLPQDIINTSDFVARVDILEEKINDIVDEWTEKKLTKKFFKVFKLTNLSETYSHELIFDAGEPSGCYLGEDFLELYYKLPVRDEIKNKKIYKANSLLLPRRKKDTGYLCFYEYSGPKLIIKSDQNKCIRLINEADIADKKVYIDSNEANDDCLNVKKWMYT